MQKPVVGLTGWRESDRYVYNDGGRAAAGFRGQIGDCVVRAIAIASGRDYWLVFRDLYRANLDLQINGRCRAAKAYRSGLWEPTPDSGVTRKVYKPYIENLGFEWTPTMAIGSGCRVHLRADELPSGVLIVRVSRHLCAVIDGVIFDTYDCSRGGTRCVYGYWRRPNGGAA